MSLVGLQIQRQKEKETGMNKLVKMATIVVGVGAMLSLAGCGGDSAKDVAIKKIKDAGFEKVEVVSEKITGDKSLVVVKISAFGGTEESKVYCSKVDGKWTVSKVD